MRGLPLVQAPTSVLAMIDAAVGGKVGIDVTRGKNLVGAFHQPRVVVIDPLVLRTLPRDEIRCGLAEAVKHGAILDRAYFDWIAADAASLLALEPSAVQRLVGRSIELKAGVVAEDPHERGRRAVLNFGHTVGHALELYSGYAVPHGFGVSVGMVAEALAGERIGITPPGTAQRIAGVLEKCNLPTWLPAQAFDGPAEGVLEAARLDKKSRDATPRVVLLAEMGRCAAAEDGSWTHRVPGDVLLGTIREVIRDPRAV
jgi:3-dehydroquinate synthase